LETNINNLNENDFNQYVKQRMLYHEEQIRNQFNPKHSEHNVRTVNHHKQIMK